MKQELIETRIYLLRQLDIILDRQALYPPMTAEYNAYDEEIDRLSAEIWGIEGELEAIEIDLDDDVIICINF